MARTLFTLCDDKFFVGFQVFMKSFLHHNPWFEDTVTVLDVGLSPSTIEEMKKIYGKIVFKIPKKGLYKKVDMSKTASSLQKTYYTLDCFYMTEYDRIIAMDMDLLVLGDLSEVFDCAKPFAAVRGYNAKLDILREDINSGVFVVNKPFIGEDHYRKMIEIAARGFSMPDQKVINIYLGKHVHHLPKIYNVEKRMITTKKFRVELEKARVIHYVASKPWDSIKEPGFEELENKWWEWYHK